MVGGWLVDLLALVFENIHLPLLPSSPFPCHAVHDAQDKQLYVSLDYEMLKFPKYNLVPIYKIHHHDVKTDTECFETHVEVFHCHN